MPRVPKRVITEELVEKVKKGDFVDEHGRINGMHPKEIAYVKALIENGGNWDQATRTALDIKGLPNTRHKATWTMRQNKMVLAYLHRLLTKGDILKQTIKAQSDALEAKTEYKGELTENPDHKTRLKAAENLQALLMEVEDKLAPPKQVDTSYEVFVEELDALPDHVLEWAMKKGRLPEPAELKRLTAFEGEVVDEKK